MASEHIQTYLDPIASSVTKDDILAMLDRNQAPQRIKDEVSSIERDTFSNMADFVDAFDKQ